MNDIYGFVYRGILTEVALDKAQPKTKDDTGDALDIESIQRSLNFDLLETKRIEDARIMSNVYIALHAVENMMRDFVIKQLSEQFGETWKDKVPQKNN